MFPKTFKEKMMKLIISDSNVFISFSDHEDEKFELKNLPSTENEQI